MILFFTYLFAAVVIVKALVDAGAVDVDVVQLPRDAALVAHLGHARHPGDEVLLLEAGDVLVPLRAALAAVHLVAGAAVALVVVDGRVGVGLQRADELPARVRVRRVVGVADRVDVADRRARRGGPRPLRRGRVRVPRAVPRDLAAVRGVLLGEGDVVKDGSRHQGGGSEKDEEGL